jgi:hypothetical protein
MIVTNPKQLYRGDLIEVVNRVHEERAIFIGATEETFYYLVTGQHSNYSKYNNYLFNSMWSDYLRGGNYIVVVGGSATEDEICAALDRSICLIAHDVMGKEPPSSMLLRQERMDRTNIPSLFFGPWGDNVA